MKKIIGGGVVVLVVLLLILINNMGNDRTTLYVYNWGDYIAEDVIDQFEAEYDVRVVYDTFSTNEDMYVKVTAGGSNYDVLFPSDYMIKRMIDEDLLAKIDLTNIPNHQYIDDTFKGLEHDPNDEYSVPYMWGTVGILYNKTMVTEPLNSWDILWDPQHSKNILMIDSQRDAIGITLKKLGYSLNSTKASELEEAKQALVEQKPLVLAYVVDEAKDKMVAGEAALAVVWSGDAVYAMRENPDLDYVIPGEGSNLWFDGMVIPKTSNNKELAEAFINFLNQTDIAFANTDYIGYSTPHVEAHKLLDPELANNIAAYPPEEALDNTEVFVHIGELLRDYDRIWTEIKAY